MLALIAYFIWMLRSEITSHKVFLLGMCMALLGDIALLNTAESAFLIGLVSFLMTQILYGYTFFRERQIGIHKHLLPIAVVSLYLIASLIYMIPKAGDMTAAVVIYSVSISAMLLFSIMRWKVKGYHSVVIGAACFIISDTMLALNKFTSISIDLGVILMLTYILAQYYIVTGYIKSIVLT